MHITQNGTLADTQKFNAENLKEMNCLESELKLSVITFSK